MAAKHNPLWKLHDLGQSVWLDFISRGMFASGELRRLIDEDGLRGMTSNPTIFNSSIAGTDYYDASISELARQGAGAQEIMEAVTVEDVRSAADIFRPVYDSSNGEEGFVSLEVSPHLAYKTQATIDEARRLWSKLDRPNVFIKVPGTQPGLAAIARLIDEGINVNVTLLFGLPRYREVAKAYIAGIERRLARGERVDRVRSVASFFLSRIDTLLDPQLEKLAQSGGPRSERARELMGEAAIGSARLAYEIYKELYRGEKFRGLEVRGARPQRLLWASTSTKNPAYSDVKYVDTLIGPETINTMPMETVEAYRDHGNPAPRLEEQVGRYGRLLADLQDMGIDLDQVTEQLEREGVDKFVKPYDELLATLERKRTEALEKARSAR